jgi:hypothetical protein
MVEHAAVNRDVEGSSPSSGAILNSFISAPKAISSGGLKLARHINFQFGKIPKHLWQPKLK